ncbi:SDH family Clp fold serine proteinase [Rhodoferax ferrireducens]|uniref:SDH family Clp fold serine proteinase n=1 Tax=Rhodoferax ferrireducens TaxID=192843 RepID=UPI003BB572DB
MTNVDIITYAGEINLKGYEAICNLLAQKKADKALLVISTPGGDPHAGFRIARALQHTYESFDALIPGSCKSAGTLVIIGAKKLYLDDMSELGPLDVQVKKSDEVVGRNSGLDILQAVNYLQSQAMNAFRGYLLELTRDAGLSTKVASDISSKLTTGLYEPVFAQIDPMRLAEMQRAMEIAFAYGNRLNDKSGNLRAGGLGQLVTGYPSHGFVIDRKEARTIFTAVEKPEGTLLEISKGLKAQMLPNIYSSIPEVNIYCIGDPNGATSSETASNSVSGSAGNAPSDGADNGNSEAESTQGDSNNDAAANQSGAPAEAA